MTYQINLPTTAPTACHRLASALNRYGMLTVKDARTLLDLRDSSVRTYASQLNRFAGCRAVRIKKDVIHLAGPVITKRPSPRVELSRNDWAFVLWCLNRGYADVKEKTPLYEQDETAIVRARAAIKELMKTGKTIRLTSTDDLEA